MYDYIAIVIWGCDQPNAINMGKYYQCRDRNGNISNMRITYDPISRKMTIRGSLRNWMAGKAYLREFESPEEFRNALELFCEVHQISFEKVWHGNLKTYEVGCTFKTPFELSDIIMDIRSSSRLKFHSMFSAASITFSDSVFDLKIYDKNLEHLSRYSHVRNANAARAFRRTNNHFNRCELRIKRKIKIDGVEILSPSDMAQAWDGWKLLLSDYINSLTLANKQTLALIPDLSAKKISEISDGHFLNQVGFDFLNKLLKVSQIADSNKANIRKRYEKGLITFNNNVIDKRHKSIEIIKRNSLARLSHAEVY